MGSDSGVREPAIERNSHTTHDLFLDVPSRWMRAAGVTLGMLRSSLGREGGAAMITIAMGQSRVKCYQ